MKTQFNLDIKTPCTENYDEFKPTPNGGFCSSCTKEVVDFTNMSSDEIASFFKNKNAINTCGRFHSNQLKTYNKHPKQVSKFSFIGSIGLACLSLFSFGTLQAQDTQNKTKNAENEDKKIIVKDNLKEVLVKGNVTDTSGVPLPGVNIVLDGTSEGVATDFDGNFVFPKKLKVGDVLIFSYIGMDSRKVVITNQDATSQLELKMEVGLQLSECILVGKVAVKEVYSSKKNK